VTIPDQSSYIKSLKVGNSFTNSDHINIFGKNIIKISAAEFGTIVEATNNCPTPFELALRGAIGDQGDPGNPGGIGDFFTVVECGQADLDSCACFDCPPECGQEDTCGEFDALCCIPGVTIPGPGENDCCCPQTENCCLPFEDSCPQGNIPNFGFGAGNFPPQGTVLG